MPDSTNVLQVILTRLSASSVADVSLEIATLDQPFYRARCGERFAYVDRVLAVRLRERGATWLGDIAKDPCAVA